MNNSTITWMLLIVVMFSIAHPGFSQDSKLKAGDVIEILVYGHEDLSRIVTVKENGTVDFPFLQDIPVDGLSTNELREIIVIQLSKYMDQKPLVTVIAPDTYPIEVTVLGQVARPGSHKIPVNSTVQGAIGEAGGFLPGADLTAIKIIRKVPTGSTDSQQNNVEINLRNFLIDADVNALPRLYNGDMIVIPSYSGSSTVKVLGEVNRPGSYEITIGNDTLLDMIFMAGGFTAEANTSKIKIISPKHKTKQEIELNLTDNLKAADYQTLPEIRPGDIVYVAKKSFSWRKYMGFLRDIITLATLYVLIDRVKRLD